MVKKFSDKSNNPERALQAWQILIGMAHNRQTVTYIGLAQTMGYGDARPIPNILNHIMRYCEQQALPPLTALVVNKGTGAPGSGLTTVENLDADREKVFGFAWYAIVPPSPDEFQKAIQ